MEHRLQVAFYHEMLAALFASAGIAHEPIEMAVLYRGPATGAATADETETARQEAQRQAVKNFFGAEEGLLERVDDPAAYLGAVHDLVTGPHSTARRIIRTEFAQIPFHLTYKCDGCLYNEFCMKRSAETDDLSLVPHLTEQDKRALQRGGITAVRELAALKSLRPKDHPSPTGETLEHSELVTAPGMETVARRLATTWPVGQRLDELIHRALRYQKWKHEPVEALSYIPGNGYASLPYSDASQNPNLVRVYVDAQHDYLHDRIYMLGALVVASEGGVEPPARRRSVVRLSEGPPDAHPREEALFVDWIAATLRAIVEVAAPDANGLARAPIHLIFVNGFVRQLLLAGLARHATTILGATALYDFVTQLAAFDSPLATFLDQEIRDHKNYPMVCQSLQAVAAFLRFDWNADVPYREIFRARLFDFWGKFDDPDVLDAPPPGVGGWFTSRARFNSQIPLEFAYAAWGEFPAKPAHGKDDLAPYRAATPELLSGFHARRLEAMEAIARDFTGNKRTEQTSFDLPDLANFEQRSRTLAHAMEEFVTIERHVELAAWKRARLAAPERRLLAGQSLVVSYLESDQDPATVAKNQGNERRRILNDEYRAAFRAANPDATRVTLPPEQKAASQWSQDGMRFRLRLETSTTGCDLDEALALSTLRPEDWLVLNPRLNVDSRLPTAEQVTFTPTAKQMLYGMRVELERITVERHQGRAVAAWAEVVMRRSGGGAAMRGFVFGAPNERPLVADMRYTLDPDPNNIYGYWAAKVAEGLVMGGENTLYALLTGAPHPPPQWPNSAAEGQARFLTGLDAFHAASALHDFEASKREFIGEHGATPLLLVQGPPGTGKSYSTAFALMARFQGAMAANLDFRVFLSCKTHAATDVLLENLHHVRKLLRDLRTAHPALFAAHIDPRLLELPLFRLRPRGDLPTGVIPIPKDGERQAGAPKAIESIQAARWCAVAATPGGTYGLIQERWAKELFDHRFVDCLVLDEASQMNLPEAVMASLPLKPDGRLVVVGDHRQMPPIVKHDWTTEPRRTFQEFRSYESLFLALLPLKPPMIKFAESFRLHADMAEFLRREIYAQDGIDYHSKKRDLIAARPIADDFVAAVLAPEHPLTVIVHDEAASQLSNRFEQDLVAPILSILADPTGYDLNPDDGLGVVVPHRAQRAALQERVPALTRIDPNTGAILVSAVDTVERFQGGERIVILVGATESDREYLLASGKFLLDPRRLTVALSRAKQKMILVAARSIFEIFSADEETFANAQLWKNLLRHTCTVPLWSGQRHTHHIEVWGNPITADPVHTRNGPPPQ